MNVLAGERVLLVKWEKLPAIISNLHDCPSNKMGLFRMDEVVEIHTSPAHFNGIFPRALQNACVGVNISEDKSTAYLVTEQGEGVSNQATYLQVGRFRGRVQRAYGHRAQHMNTQPVPEKK